MSVFGIPDLAIDLGTATTRVAGARSGICHRPSVSRETRALDRGVIVSLRAAADLLRPMLRLRRRAGIGRLRVLACAPTDVSPVERNLVRSSILEAGATSVFVIPEPLAAAIGAGIDIGAPYSRFIIDFGDGVTDGAVIREGKLTHSLAERTGCGDLRHAVRRFLTLDTGLHFSEAEAERILRTHGFTGEGTVSCQGTRAGRPAWSSIRLIDLQSALHPVLHRMLGPVKTLLHQLPPPSSAQVIEDGLYLTGGGALLPGLREAVAAETSIDTRLVPDPVGSVICGARRMLPFAAAFDLWNTWGSYEQMLSQSAPLVAD